MKCNSQKVKNIKETNLLHYNILRELVTIGYSSLCEFYADELNEIVKVTSDPIPYKTKIFDLLGYE